MISKIPERLRELRQAHGYSQEELAEKILVTRQAISKWERGDALPDTENLIALAEIYGVSIDELVGHTPAASGGEAHEDGGEENEATENASVIPMKIVPIATVTVMRSTVRLAAA